MQIRKYHYCILWSALTSSAKQAIASTPPRSTHETPISSNSCKSSTKHVARHPTCDFVQQGLPVLWCAVIMWVGIDFWIWGCHGWWFPGAKFRCFTAWLVSSAWCHRHQRPSKENGCGLSVPWPKMAVFVMFQGLALLSKWVPVVWGLGLSQIMSNHMKSASNKSSNQLEMSGTTWMPCRAIVPSGMRPLVGPPSVRSNGTSWEGGDQTARILARCPLSGGGDLGQISVLVGKTMQDVEL